MLNKIINFANLTKDYKIRNTKLYKTCQKL